MFRGSFLPYFTGVINHFIAPYFSPEELKLKEIMPTLRNDNPLSKANITQEVYYLKRQR